MKTTVFYPQVLRSLAAVFALLAVSCDKPETATSRDKNPRTSERREIRNRETRESVSRESGYHWNVGDSSSYKLELGYALGKTANGASANPAEEGLLVRGNYHLSVLSTDGDAITLAAIMSGTEILRSGHKSPAFENLADTTPAILTLSRDGAIREISFPADVPQGDRQFLRVIHSLEFQMRADSRTWTSTEAGPDSDYSYNSTYTAETSGSVIKTREIAADSNGATLVVKESKFVGKSGPCWLESLSGNETMSISNDGNLMGELLTSVLLKRSTSISLPEIATQMLNSTPKPGEFTLEPTAAAKGRISVAEQIRHEALREKFCDVPYEIPFTALEKVADTGRHADSLKALHDFRDLLIARPELAPLVAESLKSGVNPHLSSLLAHSLELANTEATQKTLASILSNPSEYSPTVLSQAIVAAGGLEVLKVPAIGEALDIIQSSSSDNADEYPLSDAALFSLSRLATSNPELKQPLIDVLTPLLQSADEESRCTAVLALANTGIYNSDLVGLAQNLLNSPGPETRAAALSYLEGATDLGSAQIQSIADLLKDSQGPVQLQAVSTLAAASQHGNRKSLDALRDISKDTSASDELREAARLAVETASATAGK